MSKSIILIAVMVLFLDVTAADTAQLGRITSQVNFRESASRSARVITVLTSGTAVSILREDPGGWYLAIHQGRTGFVHKSYVELQRKEPAARQREPISSQLTKPAGMILAGIGIILVASVLMPTLLTTATVLVSALITIVVSDLLFQLGMLYSLFGVSFGVFVILLFFRFRRRRDQSIAVDQFSPKKAA